MTAPPVVPGALVDVSAGVVVRGELVAGVTCAVVTPGGVDTELATPGSALALVNIPTHQALGVLTLVTRPAAAMRTVDTNKQEHSCRNICVLR